MSEKELIKSKERVKQHGEVFTPQWTVDKMLDQPGVKEAAESLTATFLEPSAGEGVFLVEILNRKLQVARELSESLAVYEENALLGLSTLYGIELLEDNVEMLVMNLVSEFDRHYYAAIQDFQGAYNREVGQSAKVIISANMVQGNALTRVKNDGSPIIFSEWTLLPAQRGVRKVQRVEYTFDAIVEQGDANQSVTPEKQIEEIDLFADVFADETSAPDQPELLRYVPVPFVKVGQQLIEVIE
ncbi:MAG TPA: DNA methyltransferase [Lactobacillaceae bacterium]|jgi:hypothetical protein